MFTLIDDGRALRVPARIAQGRVWLSRDTVATIEGAAPGKEEADLAELADDLERPLAIDPTEQAAYLGVSARERGRALASLRAPDFRLPDLEGRTHALSDQRGRKVLLVAYASW